MHVVIVVQSPSFNLFRAFYAECGARDDIRISVVAYPFGAEPELHSIGEVSRYLQSQRIPHTCGVGPSTEVVFDVLDLLPDLVIYQLPYEHYRPWEKAKAVRVARHVPVGHISYGMPLVEHDEGLWKIIAGNPFYQACWKVFVENAHVERQLNAFIPDRYKAIGYIKCEGLIDRATVTRAGHAGPDSRDASFRIVWKPRWTASLGTSNLLTCLHFFLQLSIRRPEISFVFYSHPLLARAVTEQTKISTPEAWAELEAAFDMLPNAYIERSGDFLEPVLSADLYIGDYSSTLAEFYLTGRPVIYTPLPVRLNALGLKLSEGWYEVHDQAEMEATIDGLIRGVDPRVAVRTRHRSLISTPQGPETPLARAFADDLVAQFHDPSSDYGAFRATLERDEEPAPLPGLASTAGPAPRRRRGRIAALRKVLFGAGRA